MRNDLVQLVQNYIRNYKIDFYSQFRLVLDRRNINCNIIVLLYFGEDKVPGIEKSVLWEWD